MKAISHLLPLLLLVVPIIWGLYGYFKTRGEVKNNLPINARSTSVVVINSAVLYALSFNIIFFIQELFLALGKRWLGLKAILYHNNHNWEGSHPMESLAQGYGAAAIFITGLICLIIVYKTKHSSHWMHLFWIWLAFQGLAQSIPQFITARSAPDTDTGQAFTYLGISEAMGIAITVAGILGMLWLGMLTSKLLVRLSPAAALIQTASGRFGYLFRIALLASILGIALIVPFRIMPWDRALAPVFVTLLSVPMVFAHAWKVKFANATNNDVNKKILIVPIVLLAIVLLIFQLVLAKGVVM